MTYHFIGIGGIGMSGLAHMLLQKGNQVSGSDIAQSYVTEGLRLGGAKVFFGHAKEQVPQDATVIYSTDIPKDNPEYRAALEHCLPILHRSDLLCELMQAHQVLAVTGTHGKTTTSALLTHVFCSSGQDPSFAVGGQLCNLESNARFGKSPYFIAEADESDGTFLKYACAGAIVTNIDNDHLAYWGSMDNLVAAFRTFMSRVTSDLLFFCQDDPILASMQILGTSYGFSQEADVRIVSFSQTGWQIRFDLEYGSKTYKDIICNLTGKHNALNAAAVFGLALACGINEEACRQGLLSFQGVKRRLEKKGEAKGIEAFDDYAHHPTEIRATVKAVRAASPDKVIVAVFQPHRYSRMQHCMKDFDYVFEDADIVVVTDLYTAKEAPIPNVTTEAIVHEIKKTSLNCLYIPRNLLVQELASHIPETCVLLTLGAGDITKVGKELIEHVQRI